MLAVRPSDGLLRKFQWGASRDLTNPRGILENSQTADSFDTGRDQGIGDAYQLSSRERPCGLLSSRVRANPLLWAIRW